MHENIDIDIGLYILTWVVISSSDIKFWSLCQKKTCNKLKKTCK